MLSVLPIYLLLLEKCNEHNSVDILITEINNCIYCNNKENCRFQGYIINFILNIFYTLFLYTLSGKSKATFVILVNIQTQIFKI